MVFTEEQNNIFHFVEKESGHGIIDAVAGAGKTTTLMECAKYIEDKSTILFCAFNNSIADEIARKFHKIGLNDVTVKTIHALGRQILSDNNSTGARIILQDNKYNEIIKDDEIQIKLKRHYEELLKINGLSFDEFDDSQKFAAKNLLNKINSKLLDINQKLRSTLTKEDIFEFENLVTHFGIFNEIELDKKHFKEELKEYFECSKILLEAGNELSERTMVIDFTDMLYLPYKWNQQPVKKFEFLFIDECQDLSKSQFAIVAKFGKRDGRILAVGDPFQSIYGFTGADVNSFNRVKEYTKAKQLPLTASFRCPKKVVELAKTIRTDMVGVKVNEGIIHNILFDDVVNIAKPGDLIISRLRAPIVLLVFSFIDKDIKVQIHKDEVREIISEIKHIFKHEELNANISTLIGGFEELKTEVLNRWKWIIQKESERITDSVERNLYIEVEQNYLKKKLEFLHKKYVLWKSECQTISDILKKIKEYISFKKNPIKLSTIHRAKGLENERVFILNYDELPFFRLQQKDWELIQELNLKYVALTRALEELYLVENKKINITKDEGSLFDNLPFD